MTPKPTNPELEPLSDERIGLLKRRAAVDLDTGLGLPEIESLELLSLLAEVERSRQLRQRLDDQIERARLVDDNWSDTLKVLYRILGAQPHQEGKGSTD